MKLFHVGLKYDNHDKDDKDSNPEFVWKCQ